MFTLRAEKTKNSTIFMQKINGIYIFLRKGYIYIYIDMYLFKIFNRYK